MSAPYTPLQVANTFLEEHGTKTDIDHMKLQKLTYCSYGWWLAVNELDGVRLTHEGPEVWRHGPIFSSLYSALNIFGREPIRTPQSLNPVESALLIKNKKDKAFIDWVWARYGHLTGLDLSALTHKHGTPWHRMAVENRYRVPKNMLILDEYIYEEFSELLKLHRQGEVATRTVAKMKQSA